MKRRTSTPRFQIPFMKRFDALKIWKRFSIHFPEEGTMTPWAGTR